MLLPVYNKLHEDVGGRPAYRGAAITLHGMASRGAWQKDLALELQDAAIRCMSVDFGYLLAARRPALDRIARKILTAYEEQLCFVSSPCAIGHSLGSLALGHALESIPDLKIERLIVFGSIIRPDYPWDVLASEGRVQAVLNEMAADDRWVKLARLWFPRSGPSGRDGFLRGAGVVHERRHTLTGHSGLQYRLHYRRVWIPFLRGAPI